MATLKELNANRRAGSFFVFEMDEEVVGYGILANRWSNGLGGQVLHVDELYVQAGPTGEGDRLGLPRADREGGARGRGRDHHHAAPGPAPRRDSCDGSATRRHRPV